MLASSSEVSLTDRELIYEPKYDGVRTLASVAPGHPVPRVRLFSRLGNDKTAQFPAIVRALQRYALRLREPVILDGEVVALDERGEPVSFQHLQGRIHLKTVRAADDAPSAFIAFDLLREGPHDLRSLPLTARRAALERVFNDPGSPVLRISPQVANDGRELYRAAIARGWEGLIAKRASSRYYSGKRTTEWAKLKLQHAQEFVIGGWTEPRGARSYFGSLILGVYDDDERLTYVAHVGTGFDEKELTRLMRRLVSLEVKTSPFDVPPPATNDTPHWVQPDIVAQVRFTEWTNDNRLRHPTYLGLRDDVTPRKVRRETQGTLIAEAKARLHDGESENASSRNASMAKTSASQGPRESRTASSRGPAGTRTASSRGPGQIGANSPVPAKTRLTTMKSGRRAGLQSGRAALAPDLQLVVDQLSDFEKSRKKGQLVLPDGDTLDVGNLQKVFWPAEGLTKGDLMRYYVQVSPYILPVVNDRPLVMKRYPNGVTSEAFYQHRAPDPIPPGIRTETLPDDDVPSRIIGGSLKALLYLAQLAAISQDPWFSRVQSPHIIDHIAFDLDPMPGISFDQVLDVARWLRDELEHVGAKGVAKTSGSDGLHVYVPMPKHTPYETALIWAQIVATVVATKHPQVATVERAVRRRGAKVYVDYLQNIEGKTLASAYSARASEFAGASTPVTWKEIDEGFDRRDFTIRTLPARIAEVGDLWSALWKTKPPDLMKVERYRRS